MKILGILGNKKYKTAYAVYDTDSLSPTITTAASHGNGMPYIFERSNRMVEVTRIGNIYGENRGTGFAGNVYDKDGISPTITTMQGGGKRTNDY